MINDKNKLQQCLNQEKNLYIGNSLVKFWLGIIRKDISVYKWLFIKHLRKAEYYFERRNLNIINMLMYQWHYINKQKLQLRLGMEIGLNVFGEGLMIHHPHGIVVNGDARVGKNCQLHGANVIGNMGSDLSAPKLGDNVRLGTGAKVLGDVYIADNVQIGAGALVIKSCYEEGALLIGVPAQVHRKESK